MPTRNAAPSIVAVLALALGFGTAPSANAATAPAWTLSTDDTELHLAVQNDTILVTSLRNPGLDWNWVPTGSPVPMPAVVRPSGTPIHWTFRDASEDTADGARQLTLRFTSDNPSLELKSIWRATKGPGPVENWVTIQNQSTTNVTFKSDPPAASLNLVSDAPVTLHFADKTQAGKGVVHQQTLAPKSAITTNRDQIPFLILNAAGTHGFYLGFEWELGGFKVSAPADANHLTASAHPITDNVVRAPGATFLVPSVYYGAYAGDIDDGSNRFKRWFWAHKITRSLHDNADEPWVEVCMQEIGGTGATSITGNTPQSVYDRLAATGAECTKMDFWDGTGGCWYTDRDWQFHPAAWPNGFDFAAKAHKAGLKASLYMGGTYKDADLSTPAGRDAELAALRERFDAGWFDVWRTDRYNAPNDPIPDTYEGVTHFLQIQDALISHSKNYRYENCANGGRYKGFAICRRMTFCTMNDDDHSVWPTRSTYYANSFAICPVQLKSDLGPTATAYQMRTDMLGSILTWASDNPVYKQHIALYKKKQRPILRGANVYHILPMADGVNWDGLQFYNPDLDKGSVFLFKPSAKAADGDSKLIKLKGLDPAATYKLTFQDRTNLNCTKSGAQLMGDGITVSGMTGDEASEIIWIDQVAP